MEDRSVNLHDLKAFLAVADCESFSRAAERLHLTQPAVSKRILALEALLDCRLFDRVGKRIHLTDAGRMLRPRADALLRDLEDAQRALKDLDQRVAGDLGLATSHHVGLHRLAPALRAFTRRFPDVHLDIRFEDSENAHELVRRAKTEIAVVTLNPRGDPDLESRLLWNDPLAFVVSEEHALARQGPLTMDRLARERPVLPGLATYTGRIVVEAFADAGLVVRPNLATNYLETIAMLVGIGLGWSVLPSSMVAPPLVTLTTDAPPLRRGLGYVTNPRRTLSNAGRAFRDVLLEFGDDGAVAGRDGEIVPTG
jgi:DNA-binding transcriptional LysR family regulator